MNFFNCMQALVIYTAAPMAINWLATNGFNAWAIILGVAELIGFYFLSIALSEFTK